MARSRVDLQCGATAVGLFPLAQLRADTHADAAAVVVSDGFSFKSDVDGLPCPKSARSACQQDWTAALGKVPSPSFTKLTPPLALSYWFVFASAGLVTVVSDPDGLRAALRPINTAAKAFALLPSGAACEAHSTSEGFVFELSKLVHECAPTVIERREAFVDSAGVYREGTLLRTDTDPTAVCP